MNDLLNKISRNAKNIKLSSTEKALMRERLVVIADQNPIQNTRKSINSWEWFMFLKAHSVAVLLVCFVFLGGISYSSKDALPGESLYGVKTSLYEGTLRFLTFTPEKRAYFEVGVLKTRLTEAQELPQGSDETLPQSEIVRGVHDQAERAFVYISALSETKPELTQGVLNEFETVLLSYASPQDSQINMMAAPAMEETATFATMSLKVAGPQMDMEADSISGVVNEFLQKTNDIRARLEE